MSKGTTALKELYNDLTQQKMSALADADAYKAQGQEQNAAYMRGEANALHHACEAVNNKLEDLQQQEWMYNIEL